MADESPIEVAVIGGGCASMAAAFELTRPEHQGKYRVSVYQLGWRLGGKGASGRGVAERIEEHGLHLWLGYYENAFRLVRECYAELGRDPAACRFATWRDAFEPAHLVGLADRSPSGKWLKWMAHFPATPGLPGDPLTKDNPYTVNGYLVRTARLLATLLQSLSAPDRSGKDSASANGGLRGTPAAVAEAVAGLLRVGQLATMGALLEAVRVLEMALELSLPGGRTQILRLIDVIAESALARIETLVAEDDELRRLWEVVDLVLAFLRGAQRFGLATDPRGFDCIDDYDTRDWLRLNGASERALGSTFVRSLYDLAFSYEDGDPGKPRMAAGQGVRGALRMFFTYRGALFWKMNAGMGDVVFAPLYEVLKKRGVRFLFFHRLENVKLADEATLAPGEKPYVEALEFDVQAHIEQGEYEPLVDVDGLPCWPSEPDYSQLVRGAELKEEKREFESFWDRCKAGTRTLRVVDDFDYVVLGVSVGTVPHVCGEILARDARWRVMVENVKTVATQAFQLWMREDMEELGWDGGPVNLSGFVEPFDTWADMRHLVEEESWDDDEVRAIAYFCNVLPTPEGQAPRSARGYLEEARQRVRESAVRFLDRDVVHLWPRARRRRRFRWEVLAGPDSAEGEARFDAQFWTANVNPSDRYVLSLPGTLKHRISPLDNTYDNLTVAGDWTQCGHNHGCVEAAVMSGRLAAHALSHSPPLAEIIGYDHP